MDRIFNYNKLPDYLDVKDLKLKFEELLDYVENENDVNLNIDFLEKITEELYELTDRQWHTYQILDKKVKDRIERWIEKVWNTKSFIFIENITSVIGMLGLTNSFKLLKNSLKEDLNEDIRTEIIDVINEVGDTIDDPYSGMKKM